MATERVERRLAAILAADVAGYSRLMGTNEEGTLERLKSHLAEVVAPKIREHRGRIVKTPAAACWRNLPASWTRYAAPTRCSAACATASPKCPTNSESGFALASISAT